MKIKSHFKIGIPFLSAVILGSFGLSSIYSTKFEFQKQQKESAAKKAALEITKKEKFDIRKAYYDLTANKDLDDWDMVRVPRPPGEE